MAGVDDDVIRQGAQPVDNRVVELPGQLLGLRRPEQVRPPNLAGKEDVAGEERDRVWAGGRVDQQVSQVLRSVARRPERPQCRRPTADLIPVVERMMEEFLRVAERPA